MPIMDEVVTPCPHSGEENAGKSISTTRNVTEYLDFMDS
jgi:hypothetical protein